MGTCVELNNEPEVQPLRNGRRPWPLPCLSPYQLCLRPWFN